MDEKATQVATGIFFVGLGLLFLTGWWWPGIMFVMAACILARAVAVGERLQDARGAWWLIGIGVIFGMPGLISDIAGTFWQFFPVILVGMGLFMIFGGKYRPCVGKGKRKNDDDQRV